MTNVCPERMLSKASVCMGKGCSLCVVMPMMCDSNGCLWNLHGEGGSVVLFWEGHEITPQGIVHPNILIYDRVSFNLRKNLKPERGWVAHPSRTWVFTRILRGLLYQPHIFGPIIPATVRCGWRNRDVYLVVQTCLMQQRVVVVVVVVVCKMSWMQHFSAFSWCLTSLGCMFGDFDVCCDGCSSSARLDGV